MRRHLSSDERGAIMLIALAFAVFGVAMLYYAVGIAQTVLLREKLQDAADATALSSAVGHARSMNFLVLLNLIMAALIAILVAFKLAETLAAIGIIVAAALAWFTSGASLSAIPPLKSVKEEMSTLYETTKDPVFTALEVLHDTADAVADVAPKAAREVAEADLRRHWQPEVQKQGVVFTTGTRSDDKLPVEDDTFDHLCERGGNLAGNLAMKPLPLLPKPIKDSIEEAAGDLTGSLSDWFCGDSGGPPPTPPPQVVRKSFPKTEEMDACKDETLSKADLDRAKKDLKNFNTKQCEESSADTEAAQPDAQGRCKEETDCSESGPYERYAERARNQCDPTTAPLPYTYTYQMRDGSVVYTYDEKLGWVRGEPTLYEPRLATQPQPACGPGSVKPTVASGYEKVVREKPGAEVNPLCSSEVAPLLPPFGRNAPRSITVEFTQVIHVLSCMKWVSEPIETSGGEGADESGDAKLPKRIRGDLKLGSEVFQTRTVVKTPLAPLPAERIVKLALWNVESPAAQPPVGHELRQYGFAQAEYFYDGVHDAADWMWNMNWRGRLRRFRLPNDASLRAELWASCFSTYQDDLEVPMHLVEAEIAH